MDLKDRESLAPTPQVIRMVYDNTPTNCVLRKVLVDCMVAVLRPSWLKRYGANMSPEFLYDFALANMEVVEEKSTWDSDKSF
nr:hypothetical protein B0A51_00404 [Rachicladosporium sp. CCFEE 5018]